MNNEFFAMEHAHRPFACDRCGCIHHVQTNHEGQIYSQKCKNWPCTAGCGDYTSMTYWGGNVAITQSSHVDSNTHQPVFLLFKGGINLREVPPTDEELREIIRLALYEAEVTLEKCRGKYTSRSSPKVIHASKLLYQARDAFSTLEKKHFA